VSYRFELRDGIASSFGRIAVEQIDRVLTDLQANGNKPVAIHESRKSLKRLRALLRLVRPGLKEHTFKTENARFRDIGALFSQDRDRHVLSETSQKCAAAMGANVRKSFAAIAADIATPSAEPAANPVDARNDAIARLKAARREMAKLRLEPDRFETLQHGLEQSYRRGRRQLRAAYAEPSDEAFHELRKSVQQHWRHMQVLQRAWPDLFVARLAAARRLSQILGDDHDIAVFLAYLHAKGRLVPAAERRAIERHCRAEQQKLRELAHPLCQQLYAERSGRFAKRVAVIWHGAVRVADIEAAHRQPAKGPAAKGPPAKKTAAKAAAKSGSRKQPASRGNSAQSSKPAP
jgi:CHAD domain-containing protein